MLVGRRRACSAAKKYSGFTGEAAHVLFASLIPQTGSTLQAPQPEVCRSSRADTYGEAVHSPASSASSAAHEGHWNYAR